MSVVMFHHPLKGDIFVDSNLMRIQRLRRRITAWTTAMSNVINSQAVACYGIALTYRPGVEWAPGHIQQFMMTLRKVFGHSLLGYAWVAELQQRGAVHYHVTLIMEKNYVFKAERYGKMTVLRNPYFQFQSYWVHGFIDFKRLVHPSPAYLMKYSQKSEQKGGDFPPGLRLFACVIRCEIDVIDKYSWAITSKPGHVRTKMYNLREDLGITFEFDGWKIKAMGSYQWARNNKTKKMVLRFTPDGTYMITWGKMWWLSESEWVYLGVEGRKSKGINRDYMEDKT